MKEMIEYGETRFDREGSCKVVMRFICVYIIADVIQGERGFHIGYTDVSCNHCLDRFLASFGGGSDLSEAI